MRQKLATEVCAMRTHHRSEFSDRDTGLTDTCGTSKGLYFHADDLPVDVETRDRVLLAAMGSPDVREIDGVGGAHPLTSKLRSSVDQSGPTRT